MIGKLKKQKRALIFCLALSMLLHLLYGIEGMKQMDALENELFLLEMENSSLERRNALYEQIIENQKQDASEPISEPEYIGTFTVTHYCPCEKCCNKTDGITYTGTQATEGRTIAVDPEVIPLGSTVIIDSHEYVAEDTGGAIKGNRLDVFMDSHQAALQAGVVQAEVYVIGGNDEEA